MKNKKPLIAVVAAFVIIAIGATVAYYTSNVILANQFEMATYQTETTENFTSPDNWKPCDETPKTISVTNHGTVDVAVRVKLEDFWQDKDGNDLPDLMKDDQKLTSINFHNGYENYWEKKGDWYVYKTNLAPNATTQPLIDSVSLSCEANLTTATTYSADGKTAQTGESPYAGGKYHVKATVQTVQADAAAEEWSQSLAKMMQRNANEPYEIDFTKKAVKSDNIATANGNGINKYTENGADIYYYRGEIDDNNVIWADFCWKIVRTTATGGIKMIYNGEPTTIGATMRCNATGKAARIGGKTYKFNNNANSPADVGYKYGTRIAYSRINSATDSSFVFSNKIYRNGDEYALDVSDGQSVTGTWSSTRGTAATRYHYFCTDGAASCDNTKIGYIFYFGSNTIIYYLPVDGYDGIEAMKTAMFTNSIDSNAKSTIESWFVTKNLDGHIAGTKNYEDDLEDAVFCNDREYYSGALKGENSDAGSDSSSYNYHSTYSRNYIKNEHNNLNPSLDCGSINDAFQVSNIAAKLEHKVGLLTADELTLAGNGHYGYSSSAFLSNGRETGTLSPIFYGIASPSSLIEARYLGWYSSYFNAGTSYAFDLRPVISLKAGTEFTSGTGLATDPYVVP